MPEFTALHLAMLASLFAIGVGVGWLLRGDRSAREKIAVDAGWQEQLEICRAQTERLRRRLARWHARVPPLLASYRERERELRGLEAELEGATRRLAELEAAQASGEAGRAGRPEPLPADQELPVACPGLTSSSSTSNTSVDPGGIGPTARLP